MSSVFEAGRVRSGAFGDVRDLMDNVLLDWSQQSLQITPGAGQGIHSSIETGTLRIDSSHWSQGALIRGHAPADTITLALPIADRNHVRFQGRTVAPAYLPLLPGSIEFEFAASVPASTLVLTIDRPTFDLYAQVFWGAPLESNGSAYSLPLPDTDACVALAVNLNQSFDALRGRADSLANPGIARLADDQLLSMIMTAGSREPRRILMPHRHRVARDAAALLRSRTDRPITVKELTELLGASWRALDQGFQEMYGVTPKNYMRVVRLHHARNDLRAADPAVKTVTDVATHWGFFHLGRFSVDYGQLFAESPSDTLWKRRRRA